MPTRRVIQSVLHNFLGTYTSRYSDYAGYWLFGFMLESLDCIEFDLLAAESIAAVPIVEFARQLAVRRFADQLRKSSLDRLRIREVTLAIKRLPKTIIEPVNGRPSNGYGVRFEVTAITDTGQRFAAARTVFVAPHNPQRDIRSSRWNESHALPG
jgi:hypothetical protein